MTERYNYIDQNKAHEMRCVHAFGEYEYIGDYTSCSGPSCMGWIAEIGDDGKPTGRGRCGMVHQIVVTTPGVSTPYDTPSRFWMEVNKVEG